MALAAAMIAATERLDEQNKHLEQICNHLDDIGTTLLDARGPDGALKVYDPLAAQ